MTILQSFQLAIKSILSNRMRSVLTMLGMIIGVGSVIIIMGMMNAVKSSMLSEFSDFGTDTLTVAYNPIGNRVVTEEDLYQIVEENKELFKGVSPTVESVKNLSYNGHKLNGETVRGVAENFLTINGAKVKDGRFLSYSDVYLRQPRCVIGTYVANELFPGENPVGKVMKIDGEDFTVIGVRAETAGSQKYLADDVVLIPYTKAARMETGFITSCVFAVKDVKDVNQGQTVIEDRLNELLGDKDAYYINNMASMLKMLDTIMGVLTGAIAGIAAISLLVAGIGIMNIMLVSVTERTREIGIRKSLGARKKDIRGQFIMESGVVSGIGGTIGILFGVLVVYIIRLLAHIDAKPTLGAIIISFSVSVGVGMLFGYMPAKKAANLNPIDALRSE